MKFKWGNIIFLVLVLGSVSLFLFEKNTTTPIFKLKKVSEINEDKNSNKNKGSQTKDNFASNVEKNSEFKSKIILESQKISHLDNNPENTKIRLFKLIESFKENDFKTLEEMTLNEQLNGDQRFFAAYLLAHSNNHLKIKHLREIIKSNQKSKNLANSEHIENRSDDDEFIIKAQALEGLASLTPNSLAINELQKVQSSIQQVNLINYARNLITQLSKK